MKLLYVGRFLRIMLCAIFVATSAHATKKNNIDRSKRTASTELIKDVLRGHRVRKKTLQQLKFQGTTKFVVSPAEEKYAVKYTGVLRDKDNEECGSIVYRAPHNGGDVELLLIKTSEKRCREGIGTYLFNAMLREIYAINRDRIKNNKKPYKRVVWIACPLEYRPGALEALIKFYESLDAQIDFRDSFSASMSLDL